MHGCIGNKATGSFLFTLKLLYSLPPQGILPENLIHQMPNGCHGKRIGAKSLKINILKNMKTANQAVILKLHHLHIQFRIKNLIKLDQI